MPILHPCTTKKKMFEMHHGVFGLFVMWKLHKGR